MASNTVTIKSYRKEREKEILDGLQKSLSKVGALVEREAKINTGGTTKHPYRKSGRLVGSITHNVGDGYVEIGTNVYYGKYLELGTVHHPPYPWLYPAVESNRGKIIDILKGIVTFE